LGDGETSAIAPIRLQQYIQQYTNICRDHYYRQFRGFVVNYDDDDGEEQFSSKEGATKDDPNMLAALRDATITKRKRELTAHCELEITMALPRIDTSLGNGIPLGSTDQEDAKNVRTVKARLLSSLLHNGCIFIRQFCKNYWKI
jgi:hypothetical protein